MGAWMYTSGPSVSESSASDGRTARACGARASCDATHVAYEDAVDETGHAFDVDTIDVDGLDIGTPNAYACDVTKNAVDAYTTDAYGVYGRASYSLKI